MKKSPLQLKRCWIESVHFDTTPPEVEVVDSVEVKAEPEFARRESDSNEWLVSLTTEISDSEEGRAKYTAVCKVFGIFVLDESLEEQKALRIVAVNAPSMLFATTREILTTLSARAPRNIFSIPTLSFAGYELTEQTEPPEKVEVRS